MAQQFLGEMVVKITGDAKGLHATIVDVQKTTEKAKNKLEEFGKGLNKIGDKMTSFGKSMSRKVTLPILAVSAAIIKMAVDSDKVFAGKIKNLQKDLQGLAVSFTTALMPVIDGAIKVIRDIVKWFTNLDENTKKTIVTVAGLAAAIGPLLGILGPLTAAFGALTAVMAANPIGAIIIAVVAAATAVAALSGQMGKLPDSIQKAKDKITANFQGIAEDVNKFGVRMAQEAQDAMTKSSGLTIDERKKLSNEFDRLRMSDREKELDDLSIKYEQYKKSNTNRLEVDNWYREQKLLLAKKYDELEKQAELDRVQTGLDAIFAKQKADDEAFEKLKEQREKENEDYRQSVSEQEQIEQNKWAAYVEIQKKAQSEQLAYDRKHAEEELAIVERGKQQAIDGAFAVTQAIINFAQQQNNAKVAQLDKDIDVNEAALSEMEQQLKDSLDAGLTLEAAALQAKIDAKKKEIDSEKSEKRKMLEANKQAAMFGVVLSTAEAIVKAISQYGLPWGLVPAAVSAALGAVQLATIASTPIPMAEGGLIMPKPGGTLVQAAEVGAPEFYVPETKSAMSRLADDITRNMSRPSVTNTTNNNTQLPGNLVIDGKSFRAWIVDEMDNGRIRVPKRAVR